MTQPTVAHHPHPHLTLSKQGGGAAKQLLQQEAATTAEYLQDGINRRLTAPHSEDLWVTICATEQRGSTGVQDQESISFLSQWFLKRREQT